LISYWDEGDAERIAL